MSQTPASKSQIRAASLCAVKIDYADYTAAGAALEAAGINSAGLPAGHTWRSAAKLSDADLLSALRASSRRPARDEAMVEDMDMLDAIARMR